MNTSVPSAPSPTRVEGFSDAAFALALTLLLISEGVPRSHAELMRLVYGIPSFACCFALLVWIWYEHSRFFRHVKLQDGVTLALNAGLLFVVLFYVYPLKFMFDSMFAQFVPALRGTVDGMTLPQLRQTSIIYGLGFVVLFLMFTLLYRHGHRRRNELALGPLETFELRAIAGHHVVSMGVGGLAVLWAVAMPLYLVPLSPSLFALMGPAHFLYGSRMDRRRTRLQAQLAAPAVEDDTRPSAV